MAAPIIIHFLSAHPMQTKRAVIHSQTLRALRLGSTVAAKNRGIQKIKNLFLSNGYLEKLITNIQSKAEHHKQRPNTEQQSLTYKTLPYIDDQLSRKINNAAKKSDLGIKIAWQGGKTLASNFDQINFRTATVPQGRGHQKTCHAYEAGAAGKCHLKNVVYQIACTLYSAVFIGETRRRVQTRFMEHLGDARNKRSGTHLGDDVRETHADAIIGNDTFKIRLLHTHIKDAAQLKITESLEIRNRRPAINKNSTSWKLIAPLQVNYSAMTNR